MMYLLFNRELATVVSAKHLSHFRANSHDVARFFLNNPDPVYPGTSDTSIDPASKQYKRHAGGNPCQ
jgi:hypothetical protein